MCSQEGNYDDPILDDVFYDDSTIVLQAKDGWTPPPEPPGGWTWDTKARTLKLKQQTFVSSADLLGKNNFSAVIFAGCASLTSSSRTQSVVQKVLSACTKVTAIHNKDLITTFLTIFPRLEELVLPHNIRLQCPTLEESDVIGGWGRPLRSIRGDCCGIGINHLLMDVQMVVYLHIKFRELVHIDVDVDEAVDIICNANTVLNVGGYVPRWQSYILGSYRQRSTLDNIVVHTGITRGPLAATLSLSKRIHRLQLVTAAEEVVKLITCFESVKSLSVTFIPQFCPFGLCFPEALKKFSLETIELRYFRDVNLSDLLQNCANLHTLSLLDCIIREEELTSGTFQHLRVLRIGAETTFSLMKFVLISKQLSAALIGRCPNLTELQLSGAQLCGAFLQPHFQKSCLTKLQKLILWTNVSTKGLGSSVSDLHVLLKDLRGLQCIATDSYDIRLFVETYAPHVKLEWLSCTKCAAEFPEANGIEMVRNKFFADICG